MRLLARTFVLLLAVGSLVACSELPPLLLPPGPSLGCRNSINAVVSIVDWELRVSPDPIESGQPFTATLGGTALFTESFLDAGNDAVPGGVKEIDLVELKATVRVRSGATGEDVVLRPEPIPSTCFVRGDPCDPDNNDLPSVPGLRGNTDCEPVSDANPCGRYVLLPTSTDCEPGGVCAARNKTGPNSQCEKNSFCITGDLQFRLQEDRGQYTADAEGHVLFGWDDQSTDATLREGGPDDGTWILPPAVYDQPTGPNGFRVTVRGLPVAFECTMGVDSQGPLGVDSLAPLSSRTPDSELISFPIQTELF